MTMRTRSISLLRTAYRGLKAQHNTAVALDASFTQRFLQQRSLVAITYVMEVDGTSRTVDAPVGSHLLEVAHENDVELEGTLLL